MAGETIETIARKLAAERYAQAITTAAAAEEKIKVLTDALADSEWRRAQAESELSTLAYPPDFPRVWGAATEEPPAEVQAIIDIACGTPYRRRIGDGMWERLGVDHAIAYEWPIEDSGPFIALADDWGIARLATTLQAVIEDHAKIRRAIVGHDGYDNPDETRWSRPGLGDATRRVFDALQRKWEESHREVSRLQRQLEDLQYQLNLYKANTDEEN